ncbi:MAG: hypothetical protein DRI61_07730 [Chloroflexi bacterium]|nr:MAG: hypothetical protein DRI61_07730 [Chloroflexota bacterium]
MKLGPNFMVDSLGLEDEQWMVEWFHTYPHQYTNFIIPPQERVLVTLSWRACEAETTIWDSDPYEPIVTKSGDRAKFWYDPADPTDIYVTKTTQTPPPPPPTCKGDFNDDGVINFDDFVEFAGVYGTSCP